MWTHTSYHIHPSIPNGVELNVKDKTENFYKNLEETLFKTVY